LDISLTLLEQFVAHAGRAAVDVITFCVKLVQKGPAVAGFADMNDAQELDKGFVHPRTTGSRVRSKWGYIVEALIWRKFRSVDG
jgi:hypothetical protein